MSAFIVDDDVICLIVQAAMEATPGPVSWFTEPFDPEWVTSSSYFQFQRSLPYDERRASEVAFMLLAENCASVNYRYEDSEALAIDTMFPYKRVVRKVIHADVFKALDCYEYQACEHPGWATSEAKQFIDELRKQMIRSLPGYAESTWWR
jgi:hypothetical protein